MRQPRRPQGWKRFGSARPDQICQQRAASETDQRHINHRYENTLAAACRDDGDVPQPGCGQEQEQGAQTSQGAKDGRTDVTNLEAKLVKDFDPRSVKPGVKK